MSQSAKNGAADSAVINQPTTAKSSVRFHIDEAKYDNGRVCWIPLRKLPDAKTNYSSVESACEKCGAIGIVNQIHRNRGHLPPCPNCGPHPTPITEEDKDAPIPGKKAAAFLGITWGALESMRNLRIVRVAQDDYLETVDRPHRLCQYIDTPELGELLTVETMRATLEKLTVPKTTGETTWRANCNGEARPERYANNLLPFRRGQGFWLTACKSPVVHETGPAETNIEIALCKQPLHLFRTLIARPIGIKEKRNFSICKAPCKPLDFRDLVLSNLVTHDRDGRHANRIETDDIVESFHHDDSALSDDLPIAGLGEPTCMLSEQFLPAVKIYREFVLVRFLLLAPLLRSQRVESLLFQLELRIARNPCQKLAVLTEDWIEDLAAKRPRSLVAAAVLRQHADTPFFHHCRRQARVPTDVGRRCGRHVSNVSHKFLVDRHQLACFFVLAVNKRHVAWRRRFLIRRCYLDGRCGARCWSMGVAAKNTSYTFELLPLEFSAGRASTGEPPVHEGEEVAAYLALVRMAGKYFLGIAGIHGEFTFAGVIAFAAEWAVESDLSAGAMDLDDDVAFCSRLFKCRLRLSVINALILLLIHAGVGKKMGTMIL